MAEKSKNPKAVTGTKAVAPKGKAPGGVVSKKGSSPVAGKKKGGGGKKGTSKAKGAGGKKGRRKKRKKAPRCPIKRRKKALKRKCYQMTDPRALLNTYYSFHGVPDMLKFRKFKWSKKKKVA